MIRANNIVFVENRYFEEVSSEVSVYTIKEPTAEGWNRKAKIQNIKMFISHFKRQPKDYLEVQAWIHTMIEDDKNKESHSAGNTMTFA